MVESLVSLVNLTFLRGADFGGYHCSFLYIGKIQRKIEKNRKFLTSSTFPNESNQYNRRSDVKRPCWKTFFFFGLNATSWGNSIPTSHACPSQFSCQSKPDFRRKPKRRSSGGQIVASYIALKSFPEMDVLGLADADADCSVSFSAIKPAGTEIIVVIAVSYGILMPVEARVSRA